MSGLDAAASLYGGDGMGDRDAPVEFTSLPGYEDLGGGGSTPSAGFGSAPGLDDDVAASMYPFRNPAGGMAPGLPVADISALQQVRPLLTTTPSFTTDPSCSCPRSDTTLIRLSSPSLFLSGPTPVTALT